MAEQLQRQQQPSGQHQQPSSQQPQQLSQQQQQPSHSSNSLASSSNSLASNSNSLASSSRSLASSSNTPTSLLQGHPWWQLPLNCRRNWPPLERLSQHRPHATAPPGWKPTRRNMPQNK
ncbi:hypothetical protein K443DRAFT_583568 [Laccaria amethystina LaAM-08-1]|uniref:Uncharacterized protein n=1 Tax=Laccaria amethystina LaAM-08-1 TaxID=1095629 RepID=A0A0C9XZ28_9AGAR|nr:hypothetical protein K443DRAFT_583568 [Laccaria amethystina LaAM-08-1]